jgi:hypothetical protein
VHALQKFAKELLTPNLHLLACKAANQARQMGHTSAHLELWVERLIQLCKSTVRNRVTAHPEKLVTNQLALLYTSNASDGRGLLEAAAEPGPEADAGSDQEDAAANEDGAGEGEGAAADRDMLGQAHVAMLGQARSGGLPSSIMDPEQLMVQLGAACEAADHAHWNDAILEQHRDRLAVDIHTAATIPGVGTVRSTLYKRNKSRDDTHIALRVAADEAAQKPAQAVIAQVLAFAQVRVPNEAGAADIHLPPLHAAIIAVKPDVGCVQNPILGDVFVSRRPGQAQAAAGAGADVNQLQVILAAQIASKVCYCKTTNNGTLYKECIFTKG